MNLVENSIRALHLYIKNENYAGYDPYDTLNSRINFQKFGKWIPILLTQFQKRNPINIRKIIGIKKTHSTKGFGLLLNAYVKLYIKTKDESLRESIEYIKNWLIENQSNYNGSNCWGYDYPYYNPKEKVNKDFPTVVHHSYIYKGFFEYYKLFNDDKVKNILIKNLDFIKNEIPIIEYQEGISFGYNPQSVDLVCYNASLHASYCLSIGYYFTNDVNLLNKAVRAVEFVISRQREDGSWFYSADRELLKERKQIDFHQGFILESIFDIKKLLKINNEKWENSIKKGLKFYYKEQFNEDGWSYYRLPQKYPIDVHNQSQGIITFEKLKEYDMKYNVFALKITKWTILNMQSKKGYFYYRKYKYFTNKISYMRWSQAWMLLALSYMQEQVCEQKIFNK